MPPYRASLRRRWLRRQEKSGASHLCSMPPFRASLRRKVASAAENGFGSFNVLSSRAPLPWSLRRLAFSSRAIHTYPRSKTGRRHLFLTEFKVHQKKAVVASPLLLRRLPAEPLCLYPYCGPVGNRLQTHKPAGQFPSLFIAALTGKPLRRKVARAAKAPTNPPPTLSGALRASC